jgi:4-hydroxythreonine-4-phosphate dehydrogenase
MREALRITQTPGNVRPIAAIAEARFAAGELDVLDLRNVDLANLQRGQVSTVAGKAAYEYVACAVELAVHHEIDAIVTSALHKEALNLAGYHYAGHTEILADLIKTPRVTMMLVGANLCVSHVSTHCSLRQAIERCKTARILEVIRLTHQALLQMDIAAPRLAVAGLNPHSGEGGLFGDEERLEITPAIQAARAEGLDVYPAPLAPDTVFYRMKEGQFDAVVAQYHDQGHIPLKLLAFDDGVNITLGLPIIRTSVDHGTAFDKAGLGTARPGSMIAALKLADLMARKRNG